MRIYKCVCACESSRLCVNLRGSSFFRHSGVLPAVRHRLQRRPGGAEPARLSSLQGVSSPSNLQSLPPPPPATPTPCSATATAAPPHHRPLKKKEKKDKRKKTKNKTKNKKQIWDPSMPQQQLGIRLSSPKVTAGAAAGFPRPRDRGASTE